MECYIPKRRNPRGKIGWQRTGNTDLPVVKIMHQRLSGSDQLVKVFTSCIAAQEKYMHRCFTRQPRHRHANRQHGRQHHDWSGKWRLSR